MEKYPVLGVVRSILFVGGWITIVVAVGLAELLSVLVNIEVNIRARRAQ